MVGVTTTHVTVLGGAVLGGMRTSVLELSVFKPLSVVRVMAWWVKCLASNYESSVWIPRTHSTVQSAIPIQLRGDGKRGTRRTLEDNGQLAWHK